MIEQQSAITGDELTTLDTYWRAANYLSVGQIYLIGNPLLREPLKLEHIKKRLLGHWGTTPGLNFVIAHLNRTIVQRDLNAIFVCGPGHGGPAVVANAYLEGTYSELYSDIGLDERGLQKLFKQFSFPYGIPSHASADTPGSINEGGELGYSLAHAFGAAYDNPDLLVACVVGDGEAETGALAASWHSAKFLNATRDGAVLPILHLNGYKIANPTLLGRMSDEDLLSLFRGYGYEPFVVAGHEPHDMHRQMAGALDRVLDRIAEIQHNARSRNAQDVARWPMIILRSPKGWTGPGVVDGKQIEGTSRAHQIPLGDFESHPDHLQLLETWMRSYDPGSLFDAEGKPAERILKYAPRGDRRMSANPHANGGALLHDLHLPDFTSYATPVETPGTAVAESTRIMGAFLRDVARENPHNFRVMGPDETASNRLDALFEATKRTWLEAQIPAADDNLAPDGRVMEVLSEHLCQGWLEGYLLTGRHGLFNCYEAFAHIVDSMFNQHAKWLEACKHIPWRRPIASLNYLLSSHVWRQDHNGFSHQDPGFIDNVLNKKPELVRVYLPPDANTLLSVTDHCLRSRNYVNVIVAGKQPELQWLDMDSAVRHCTHGAGIWEWACTDRDREPDIVMACAGDIPTLEILAAVELLHEAFDDLAIRTVNVVDLMTLQPPGDHPHGLPESEFDAIFTRSTPVIFAYHGYPWLIHRLTYKRAIHDDLHVHGYREEGTTTTPFDMTVRNGIDRFSLAIAAVERMGSRLGNRGAHAQQQWRDRLVDHRRYVAHVGDDLPEVKNWKWSGFGPR